MQHDLKLDCYNLASVHLVELNSTCIISYQRNSLGGGTSPVNNLSKIKAVRRASHDYSLSEAYEWNGQSGQVSGHSKQRIFRLEYNQIETFNKLSRDQFL